MVGSGRRFDQDGFLKKLDSIYGYVVSDITQFPNVPYWKVTAACVRGWWSAGKLGTSTKIPRERMLQLLQQVETR